MLAKIKRKTQTQRRRVSRGAEKRRNANLLPRCDLCLLCASALKSEGDLCPPSSASNKSSRQKALQNINPRDAEVVEKSRTFSDPLCPSRPLRFHFIHHRPLQWPSTVLAVCLYWCIRGLQLSGVWMKNMFLIGSDPGLYNPLAESFRFP